MQVSLKYRAINASMLKPSCLAILCGVAVILAIAKLHASHPPPPQQHVYELRIYHV